MLVSDFVADSAHRLPGKTALVFQGVRYSYGELHRKVLRLAAALVEEGLRTGDRVGIYLGNSVETIVGIFAALEAGGCFVILNPSIKSEKLSYMLRNSQAKFLIAPADRREALLEAMARVSTPPRVILTGNVETDELCFEELTSREPRVIPKRAIDIDLAAIIYTSGSTGEPKGVTLTHRNIVSAASSITTYLKNTPQDVIINLLPFSFDYGLYQMLMAFKIGGTLVLETGFGYPFEIVKLIKRERVTGFPGVPTVFAILLQLERLNEHDLSSVRYVTNTAAPLPAAFIPKLKKAFPSAEIYSMYGLTECKRVSYLPPHLLNLKPDSVGIPMSNTEVWIVDENEGVLPPGEVGQLVVRGANVMQGYWGDPESTDRVLKPGRYPWEKVLYTGDLFKMDEEGCLYFVGRQDDLIKSRGERVSPKEVENAIYGLQEVLLTRVSGVPHEILGQAIRAEIVLKDGCTLTGHQVKAYCREHLEELMVPQIIEFVKEIIVTSSGKVKRRG